MDQKSKIFEKKNPLKSGKDWIKTSMRPGRCWVNCSFNVCDQQRIPKPATAWSSTSSNNIIRYDFIINFEKEYNKQIIIANDENVDWWRISKSQLEVWCTFSISKNWIKLGNVRIFIIILTNKRHQQQNGRATSKVLCIVRANISNVIFTIRWTTWILLKSIVASSTNES